MDAAIEDLIKEGKLVGGCNVMDSGRTIFLDAYGYLPAKGVHIASDYGPNIFEGRSDVYFAVKNKGVNGIARRASILLYEDQKELLKRLRAECEIKDEVGTRHTLWNLEKRSFVTLETMMRAEAKGIYEGRKRFEPFADPKNKDIIYECLPFLFAEHRAELLGLSKTCGAYFKRNKGKLEKLAKDLGITPEEVLDNIPDLTGNCSGNNKYYVGGCVICEQECH